MSESSSNAKSNRSGQPGELPLAKKAERAYLVAASTASAVGWPLEDSLAELAELARTAGLTVTGQAVQHLQSINPSTYLGKGKIEEIAALKEELNFDVVIVDDELSPSQQRNIEEKLQVQVLDRTALILDIFAQRARTREGRVQVELAQYQYFLPRLTRLWTHFSRQAVGGVGLRGPGETQLESDRRRIRTRISALRKELEAVSRQRTLYRVRRKEHAVPIAAIVGYTNAGKSTLLNSLSSAGVLAEDKLFATLDPTTRRIVLTGGQAVLLTDTVGFIQKLPTQLVAAFRATLEELNEADVLIHVVDITHKNASEHVQTVAGILKDLGVTGMPTITVLNKVDQFVARSLAGSNGGVSEEELKALRGEAMEIQPLASSVGDVVAVSAMHGWGLSDLLQMIESVLARDNVAIDVVIPYDMGKLVSLLHERGVIDSEDHAPSGTHIIGRVPAHLASLFAAYSNG